MFTVSDGPMSQGPQLGDLGWKVDDGVEKLNKPSTDFPDPFVL